MKLLTIALLAGLAAAAIAFLVKQSAGWTTDGQIVGRWTCKARMDGAELQSDMMFAPDGALPTTVWVRAHKDGHSIAAKMTSEDNWQVRKSTLKIDHGDQTLVSATGDGQMLPFEAVRPLFERDGGGSTFHAIETLTDTALAYRSGAGLVKCER